MELWISQEQQKINKFNKKLFPGILLEAVLLTLVFGVGTEEMIHILTKGHAPVMFVALTGGAFCSGFCLKDGSASEYRSVWRVLYVQQHCLWFYILMFRME